MGAARVPALARAGRPAAGRGPPEHPDRHLRRQRLDRHHAVHRQRPAPARYPAVTEQEGRIRHQSERKHGPPAAFDAEYHPTSAARTAEPGSFEHWATERYCLYTLDQSQTVQRGEIHHPPWPLRDATAAIARNTMTAPYGIEIDPHPVAHFAERQDVVFWPLEPVDGDG